MPDDDRVASTLAEWRQNLGRPSILATQSERRADAERIARKAVAALEAVLKLHTPRQSVVRHICKRHGAGIGTTRTMTAAEWRDEVDACPDCIKQPTTICAHCENIRICDDEWPCPTCVAITTTLTRGGGDD